jgi:hypothetical protein
MAEIAIVLRCSPAEVAALDDNDLATLVDVVKAMK